MTVRANICSNCQFWDRKGLTNEGECRAHAPSAGMFPVTSEAEWCLQHLTGEALDLRCKTCAAFDPSKEGFGRCKLTGPNLVTKPAIDRLGLRSIDGEWLWPEVDQSEWCGLHSDAGELPF